MNKTKYFIFMKWIFVGSLVAGCLGSALLFFWQPSEDPLRLYLMLSVDWEGDTLREKNLQALQDFNAKYPNYPVIHFLNAAYYSKNWSLTDDEITSAIQSTVKNNDEVGLHIHSWENLVRAAGVSYRNSPGFWSEQSRPRGNERGDDVPLNAYTETEILKIIQFSLSKLKAQGFSDIHSFRGGGWISGARVQSALLQAGISIDSSAIPPELFDKLYPDTPLSSMIQTLWGSINSDQLPYWIKLPAGRIKQFPNNAGLADYVTGEDLFAIYQELWMQAKTSKSPHIYLHYGWHQESAIEYFEHNTEGGTSLVDSHFIDRVFRGLEMINAHAKEHQIEIIPTAFSDFPPF